MQLLGPRVLHQQLVPKRNGVHIIPSCRGFQVFHRGCIARINLNDRKESGLRLIHPLPYPLGLCERDTFYQELERLCNLKEGHHFFRDGLLVQLPGPRVTAPTARPQKKWCPHSSKLQSLSSFLWRVSPSDKPKGQRREWIPTHSLSALSFRLMRARHALSRTWKALQLERMWTPFRFETGCWCSYSALVYCINISFPNEMVSTFFQVADAFKFFIEGVSLGKA